MGGSDWPVLVLSRKNGGLAIKEGRIMPEFIQITTTTDNHLLALQIAEQLVEKKLAACVQISAPITSVYEWKGKVEQTREWACVIKTRTELYPQVEEEIKTIHSYEVPEIIAVPVAAGSKAYLDWMADVTKK
jgi:periplasmic divalent cation tolerance protein